jgi:hypothetical protein
VVFIIYKFSSIWKNSKAFVSGPDPMNSAAQWATPIWNGLKLVLGPPISGTGTGEPLASSACRIPARPASHRRPDADVQDRGCLLSFSFPYKKGDPAEGSSFTISPMPR